MIDLHIFKSLLSYFQFNLDNIADLDVNTRVCNPIWGKEGSFILQDIIHTKRQSLGELVSI